MHVLKTSQKYCTCHAKRFATRHQTRPHVTKCHPCHAKRSYVTRETSKDDPSWKTSYRHGHMAHGRLRTLANSCGRFRTVGQHQANTPPPPDPQSETGTLATHSGKTAKSIENKHKNNSGKKWKKGAKKGPVRVHLSACILFFDLLFVV